MVRGCASTTPEIGRRVREVFGTHRDPELHSPIGAFRRLHAPYVFHYFQEPSDVVDARPLRNRF